MYEVGIFDNPQKIQAIPAAADGAVAHATSGPCLQQNLVCVLEGV